MSGADPHAGMRLLAAGAAPENARLGLILLHGRGAAAHDILRLHDELSATDISALAPEAAGRSWWPVSFLEPMAALQPWLDSALGAVGRALAALEAAGLPRARIAVAGFSQGACLALEFGARTGGRLHAIWGVSGGLVGTSDAAGPRQKALHGRAPKRFDYATDLCGTPVWLSCHATDPHIPRKRVEDSAAIFGQLGARVATRIHPGAGHAILASDMAALRASVAIRAETP